LKSQLFSLKTKFKSSGRGVAVSLYVTAAIIFTLVGILISANFDLTPQTKAQAPTNITQTGIYPVQDSDEGLVSPFVKVVENVQEAVVNISAQSLEANSPWWHQGSRYATASGSGFFFREDGYILTNNHVVSQAEQLYVTTASGYKYEARIVGADPQTDLAVLKIDPKDERIVVIPFGNSENIKVGDWAIAIGNPFPQQGLDRTVTVGVISAKGRSNLRFGSDTPMYQNYIQTDASINPGNSGGPLLNLRGEVVGVNAAISSPTGGSVGIGFAIPINLARSVVPDLIAEGSVNRGWLGVWLGQMNEQEARKQGMDGVYGVKIDSVFANSPAENAGIRSGDVIVKVNNQQVNNNSQLSVLISQAKDGQELPIEVIRDGKKVMLKTVIGDRETFIASSGSQPTDDFPKYNWMGMELLTFTPEIARALNVNHANGVLVQRVSQGSPADNSSIARGTVILQINNETIRTIEDVRRIGNSLSNSNSRIPIIVIEPDGTIARKVLRP
jgi:Do/DeqQ family serine protease